MDNALKLIRSELDALDEQLLDLLNRRAALSLRAGAAKRAAGAALRHPQREAAITARLAELSQSRGGLLNAAQLAHIYQSIFEVSRRLQSEGPLLQNEEALSHNEKPLLQGEELPLPPSHPSPLAHDKEPLC